MLDNCLDLQIMVKICDSAYISTITATSSVFRQEVRSFEQAIPIKPMSTKTAIKNHVMEIHSVHLRDLQTKNKTVNFMCSRIQMVLNVEIISDLTLLFQLGDLCHLFFRFQ